MKIQINNILLWWLVTKDIRVLNNYAPNNSFFWNRYILMVEFVEVINFVEAIETIMETIT